MCREDGSLNVGKLKGLVGVGKVGGSYSVGRKDR